MSSMGTKSRPVQQRLDNDSLSPSSITSLRYPRYLQLSAYQISTLAIQERLSRRAIAPHEPLTTTNARLLPSQGTRTIRFPIDENCQDCLVRTRNSNKSIFCSLAPSRPYKVPLTTGLAWSPCLPYPLSLQLAPDPPLLDGVPTTLRES